MSKKKSYYELLGVPRDATPEQIQHRYRHLARQYHPDVATDKEVAQHIFTQYTALYEVLRDPQRRAEYDRSLPPAPAPPRSPLESPSMDRLLREAEGDALAAAGEYEQALELYRQAQGRKPNPFLDVKIARMEAKLAAPGAGVPSASEGEQKRPVWQRLFKKP